MDPWQPRTLRTDVAEMKEGPEDWSHQVDGVPEGRASQAARKEEASPKGPARLTCRRSS